MRIVYHNPLYDTIYAQRTVYNGYKNAFLDLKHDFVGYSVHSLPFLLDSFRPQIFITSSHFLYRKYLDFELLKKYRKKGMVLFTKIDFWRSPISKRINEARSLKYDTESRTLMKKGLLGDVYFHVVEQEDPRMEGFERETGQTFHTIPLAADKTVLEKSVFQPRFQADISFVGTYLSDKRRFFKEYVFPLRQCYDLRLYGQDWSAGGRMAGWFQRAGQYFNIPGFRSLQKPKLTLEEEGHVYISSKICLNVHEEYQRKFGGDCNERTFKIPMSGGFEITDDVSCIRKYFVNDKEIVIAASKPEWFDKIDFYIRNPNKRSRIIDAGKKKVLEQHTYHHRVGRILDIYNTFIS